MRLNAVKMLGISITTSPQKEILEEIHKYLEQSQKKSQKPLIIVTPNPEQLVLAQKNLHFFDVLNRADIAIPDGIGLIWASKFLQQKVHLVRISGIDLMEDLVRVASERVYPVALIGGRGVSAVKALECLQKEYPNLKGWAQNPGEVNYTGKSNLDYKKIQKTDVRLIFVGLGAPKQEFFIEELTKNLRGVVLMSVGGSFDLIAGKIPRAPKFLRNLGLEWLWRLVFEPWRIKRQLALLTFVWLVLKERK